MLIYTKDDLKHFFVRVLLSIEFCLLFAFNCLNYVNYDAFIYIKACAVLIIYLIL